MQNKHERKRQFGRPGPFLVCLIVLVSAVRTSHATDEVSLQLTLAEAVEQAFRASPVLVAREAELRQVEARLLAARTYPLNPQLGMSVGDRQSQIESSTDLNIEVSQELQIGGQRGKRVAVVTAELEAAWAGFRREQRVLAATVHFAFARSLRARELIGVASADHELTKELVDFATRRLAAGAGTQIELNLARSTAGQTERSLRLAEAEYEVSVNLLSAVIAHTTGERLEPAGDLPIPEGDLPPLQTLVDSALEHRADLAALRKGIESAEQSVRFEKSLVIPNLSLGAFYTEEEATDQIKGLTLTLPIPLFNRNRGEVAEARAEVDRVSAEELVAKLEVRREVADAVATYQAAHRAADSLQDLVVATLEENLALLQRALEAGKIGASNVLILRREFVEGQRQLIEVLSEAWVARIGLDLATGRTSIPMLTEQEVLP